MKKIALLIVAPLLFISSLTSCGGGGDTPTPSKEISELVVNTKVASFTYQAGYRFSKDDLTVKVKYTDGSISDPLNDDDYTVNPELPYKFEVSDIETGKEFTVSYLTKETKIKINVVPALEKIEATSKKDEFVVGETFDKSNLTVTAIYNNASKKVLEADDYDVSPTLPYQFKDEDIGSKTFTVSYQGKTNDVSVTVKEATVLVTKVTITNTTFEVKENETLELTAEVEPDTATLPTLKWTVEGGTGKASIVEESGKVYLKGTLEGNVIVKASAIDTSGKFDSKAFTITGLSEEEKFYNTYKKASDSFQADYMLYANGRITFTDDYTEKVYSLYSLGYSYKDSVALTGRRACVTVKSIGLDIDIGGGDNFTFYDDEDKGIKAYISSLRDAGAQVTFTSDKSSGESSFSYTNESKNESKTYRFNSLGYLIKYIEKSSVRKSKYTITYSGNPTNIQLTVDNSTEVSARYLNPSVYDISLQIVPRRSTTFKLEIKEEPTSGIVRVKVYDLRNPTKNEFSMDFKPGEIVQRAIVGCEFYNWTSIFITCEWIQ